MITVTIRVPGAGELSKALCLSGLDLRAGIVCQTRGARSTDSVSFLCGCIANAERPDQLNHIGGTGVDGCVPVVLLTQSDYLYAYRTHGSTPIELSVCGQERMCETAYDPVPVPESQLASAQADVQQYVSPTHRCVKCRAAIRPNSSCRCPVCDCVLSSSDLESISGHVQPKPDPYVEHRAKEAAALSQATQNRTTHMVTGWYA